MEDAKGTRPLFLREQTFSANRAHVPCTGRGLPMAVTAQGAPKVRGKGTDTMLRDTLWDRTKMRTRASFHRLGGLGRGTGPVG